MQGGNRLGSTLNQLRTPSNTFWHDNPLNNAFVPFEPIKTADYLFSPMIIHDLFYLFNFSML